MRRHERSSSRDSQNSQQSNSSILRKRKSRSDSAERKKSSYDLETASEIRRRERSFSHDSQDSPRSNSSILYKRKSRSGSAESRKSSNYAETASDHGMKDGSSPNESDNESEKSLKVADDNEKSDDSNVDCVKSKQKNIDSEFNAIKTTKKSRIIDTDSDEERKQTFNDKVSPTADALFGDASDISTDDEKDKQEEDSIDRKDENKNKSRSRSRSRSRSKSRSGSRSRSRSKSKSKSRSRSRSVSRGKSESGDEGPSHQAVVEDDEDKEKEEEPEPPPETRIDVEIPKITTDLGREIHFVKLPNFLSVETRPFDHETYEDEIDEEETLDEEGRARLKLKVENTVRWKEVFNKEGKVVKESNARFVRWSDGSMSLHLGSEIFDVYKQPLQGDHNHLYIRQGTGLQGQSVFRTKLTFRPHSTESFTHRKMTMSLADRSQKTSGIKVLSQVGMNPDQNRYEMIKKEEEKLRMAMRMQNKPKKASSGGRSSNRASGGYGNEIYHDDASDDEGAISLAAIKNKYKKGTSAMALKVAANIYSSDEEGSDFETMRPKKNVKSKVLKDSDEEPSGSASDSDKDNQGDNMSDS